MERKECLYEKCWKKLLITIFTCVFSFSTFHIAEARELSTASADSMQAQIVNITNDTFEGSKLRTDRMKIQDTPKG